MKSAPATPASGRHQSAAFEVRPRLRRAAPGSAPAGSEGTMGPTKNGALISVMTAVFLTLMIQAALTFQKYSFDRGLMLGSTMAAVDWCEDVARRKNLRPSRLTLVLIATIATAFTATLQQAAQVLATALTQAITHS